MADATGDDLERRWADANRELKEIGKTKTGAPGDEWVQREQELLAELDHIEHEVGLRYIEQQRKERRTTNDPI